MCTRFGESWYRPRRQWRGCSSAVAGSSFDVSGISGFFPRDAGTLLGGSLGVEANLYNFLSDSSVVIMIPRVSCGARERKNVRARSRGMATLPMVSSECAVGGADDYNSSRVALLSY